MGLAPQPNLQHNGHPNLRIFWYVAAAIIVRARRRRQGANLSSLSDAQGPLSVADGTAFRLPTEDEVVLRVRRGPFSLNLPRGFADSASESEQEGGATRR